MEDFTINRVRTVIDVPVAVERPQGVALSRLVEVVDFRPVQLRVERPLMVENIIERVVPIERLVVKEVRVPVEHVVERPKYIENIVRKEVERLVERPQPVDEFVEIPVVCYSQRIISVTALKPLFRDKPVRLSRPRLLQQSISVPRRVEKVLFRALREIIAVVVPSLLVEEAVEVLAVELPALIVKEVPAPSQRTITFETITTTEHATFVEKVVERPVQIERVIEKRVEKIIEKEVVEEVEVPVYINVHVQVTKPVIREVLVEEFVDVEVVRETFEFLPPNEEPYSFASQKIDFFCQKFNEEMITLRAENVRLSTRKVDVDNEIYRFKEFYSERGSMRYRELFALHRELNSRLKNANDENSMLRKKLSARVVMPEHVLHTNPEAERLLAQLQFLLSENAKLVEQIQNKASQLQSVMANYI